MKLLHLLNPVFIILNLGGQSSVFHNLLDCCIIYKYLFEWLKQKTFGTMQKLYIQMQ